MPFFSRKQGPTLRNILLFAFLPLILILAIQGMGVVYVHNNAISKQYNAVNEEFKVRMLFGQMAELRLMVYHYLDQLNRTEMQVLEQQIREKQDLVNGILGKMGVAESVIKENEAVTDEIVKLHHDFWTKTAINLLNGESKALHEKIHAIVQKNAATIVQAAKQNAEKSKLISIWVAIGLVAVSIVIAVVCALFLMRHIIKPIEDCTQIAGSMLKGDFSKSFAVKRNDEIGDLINAFNSMTIGLQKILEETKRLITAVQNERLDVRGDETLFEGGWRDLVAGINKVIDAARQTEQALRKSEDRYRGLFEDSPISIWEEDFSHCKKFMDALRRSGITDFRTYFENNPEAVAHCASLVRIHEINKTTLALFGARHKKELFAGLPGIFTEDSLTAFRQELLVLAEGGRRFECEAVQRTLTGELKHVALKLSVAPGYETSLGRVLVSMIDITERKQAEQALERHQQQLEERIAMATAELRAAKEQAEAANTSKSDFLARMSHEMRTPLNAVTGLTAITLRTEMTAKQRDYLNKIHSASNNLLEVINDILDFSKVEAGRLDIAHAPFELDQLMEALADMFGSRVSQKELELIISLPPNVPRNLKGDAGRLSQVLTNLIDNAIKFTELGEIVVKVEARGAAPPQGGQTTLQFSVIDSGIGIAADVLPILFEPFTQVSGYLTRNHQGTGLGLAICRRLVELMGGRIWVQSTPGVGSTFSFTIPIKVEADQKLRFNPPPDMQGLKTLVVDDSTAAGTALVDLLESFCFRAAAVDSGPKALEALRRAAADGAPYQLVLLDLKMPGMDGMQTAAGIHDQQLPAPPPFTIMVTAYDLKQVKNPIGDPMVNRYLPKPVKAIQLFNTIMELFNREETLKPSVEAREEDPKKRLAGYRVLLVEDNELNQEVAETLLKEIGLAVETAENGQIAVEKVAAAQTGFYHAVLMDIQMPVMDGLESTKNIRAFEKQQAAVSNFQFSSPAPKVSRTPIIALTAHALKNEIEKCLSAGMDDYIAKPIDMEQLNQVLIKWIAPDQKTSPATERHSAGHPNSCPPLLDISIPLKRVGGRRQILVNALEKFAPECSTAHTQIAQELRTGNTKIAARIAHTIKGTAALVGAEPLNRAAADLEKAIRQVNPDIDGMLAFFEEKLKQTVAAVDQFLKKENESQ